MRVEKDIAYLSANRTEKCDLYLPTTMPAGQRVPGIVLIHGGGWKSGDKGAGREQNIANTLVPRGYVCMSINYFLDSPAAPAWPRNIHDCKTAVQFLRVNADRYHIDPEHIGVIGGSAGGHLSAMVGLTGPDDHLEPDQPYPGVSSRVQAVVDLYGIANLATKYSQQGQKVFLGVTREENPELWKLASPVGHASATAPPFLILHGTADETVPYEQSIELQETLVRAGAKSECLLVVGAPHTFNLQPKQCDLRPLVINFFDKHLKGQGLP